VASSHAVEPVTFIAEDGVRLEGELRPSETAPRGTAVICHPHPQYGGSKDHPILWALRNQLAGHGLSVLTFNFRGVMGSGGTFGGGRDEVRDVRGAIGFVRRSAPDLPTVVCGWSFGASVALREALDDDRVRALALVGIPLRPNDLTLPELPGPSELHGFRRPVCLLAGDADTFCPPEEIQAFATAFPDVHLVILEGTDHYLWRREREAAQVVGDFVEGVLESYPGP
jgi:alpha/beta superfamily hydrolase